MKAPWFKRRGLLFTPASVIGWLILAGVIGYSVYVFVDIDSRSHSVSDTLMNFFFNVLIIYVVYSLIGFFTSRSRKEE
jgi:membrane protein DedA with SNARE-associated domain